MKKLFFLILAIASLFALASITYSADEALTPEKLSGIWKGSARLIAPGQAYFDHSCRLLITPSLNGLLRCNSQMGNPAYDFDQGEIINNQLVVRDREMPNTIRLKAYITSKNRLEGEVQLRRVKGDLYGCKKIRELTDEERQMPLAQLEGLLK
jgi:hypothetical protein